MKDANKLFKDSLDKAFSGNREGLSDLQKYKTMVGETEKLKGGLADKKTLKDIAKMHLKKGGDLDAMMAQLQKQLKLGLKIEKEHTDDAKKAREIAMDHLAEDPKYYTKIKKMEAQEATTTASSGQYSAPLFSKMETKEATTTASSGAYETPAAWAPSTSKKDWRGANKPQIPGGKFVTVKKQCKTFPYCNQGDIKAIKIYESYIEEVANKYDYDADDLKYLFLEYLRNENKDIYNKNIDMDLDKLIDEVVSEEIEKRSKYMAESAIKEKLIGKQKNLDKNKNNKLDAEDFEMLRKSKKAHTKEEKEAMERREKFFGEVDEAKGEKKWIQKAVKRPGALHKHFNVPEGETIPKSKLNALKKELTNKAKGDKKLNASDSRLLKQVNFALNVGSLKENVVKITENELVDLIYETLLEEKKKLDTTKPEGMRVTQKMLDVSGKESKKHLKDVGKKMRDYVGKSYKENPDKFPQRNGGDRVAYTQSDAVDDYVTNFIPGMENLVYDEIEPNEDWMKKNIEGSSVTGNNPDWANAEKTDLGKKINKKRKDNLYGKEKKNGSYKRFPQPVDVTGNSKKKGGLDTFFSKNESINTNDNLIKEELSKINYLVSYNKKTQ